MIQMYRWEFRCIDGSSDGNMRVQMYRREYRCIDVGSDIWIGYICIGGVSDV